jgi:putative transcriptional regulator
MEDTAFSLQNQFLIAMPGMLDDNFNQAVVYVCAHGDEGMMGLVINHPIEDILLSEVFAQMDVSTENQLINEVPVYLGGPVQPERGFIIHRPNQSWQSTLITSDDVGVTSSQDILQAIADGEGPEDITVVLGYSGWGAGQIEDEITQNSWLTMPADNDILFNVHYSNRWKAAMDKLGVDVSHLSSDAGHA